MGMRLKAVSGTINRSESSRLHSPSPIKSDALITSALAPSTQAVQVSSNCQFERRCDEERAKHTDMSNLLLHTHCANHSTNIVDLRCERTRINFFTVQILASNTNGNNPILTVLLDGTLKGILFPFEVRIILCPHTNKQLCFRCDGSRHSKSQCIAIARRV
jgi:hypothetical protein